MRQKTRGMSIRFKILIPAGVLILAVCAVMGLVFYQKISEGMVSMGVEEAQMAAKIATQAIDGDLVKQLEPGCEETEGYQKLLTSMRELQEDFGIAYLYTLYTDGK